MMAGGLLTLSDDSRGHKPSSPLPPSPTITPPPPHHPPTHPTHPSTRHHTHQRLEFQVERVFESLLQTVREEAKETFLSVLVPRSGILKGHAAVGRGSGGGGVRVEGVVVLCAGRGGGGTVCGSREWWYCVRVEGVVVLCAGRGSGGTVCGSREWWYCVRGALEHVRDGKRALVQLSEAMGHRQ
jgi:hypothetical protein